MAHDPIAVPAADTPENRADMDFEAELRRLE